jgi:hypothetical protein
MIPTQQILNLDSGSCFKKPGSTPFSYGQESEGKVRVPDDPCLKRIVKHVGIFAAIHIHQVSHVGVGPRFLNKCTLWGNVPDPIYGATPGYSDQFTRIFNSEIRKPLISYCRFSECVFFYGEFIW